MTRVRVESFAISLDRHGVAGSHQRLDDGFGESAEALHDWLVPTRAFQRTCGSGEGTLGYRCVRLAASEHAAHVVLRRQPVVPPP